MLSFGASPLEVLAREAMIQGLVYCDEFIYSCSWIQGTDSFLDVGGDKTRNIQINSDSDFICQQYNLTAFTDPATLLEHPNFLLTITRSGAGRLLMDSPIHVANVTGNYFSNASFPGSMPISSLYQGNMTVQNRLQNLSGFAVGRVDLAFRGFKVFYQTNMSGVTGNRQSIFHAL